MGMHMGPHGMGGGGGSPWGLMRSMRRDSAVKSERLKPGTFKRIIRFASPYRGLLILFLLVIVISALATAANPLLLRDIIDKGILHKNSGLVVTLALIVGALAVFSGALNLLQRWVSATIGEGLIYDMRSRVFDHVSRMPIAFFTRTQTGALISRLNNDVLGAQQAFTDTFSSVVGNLISVVVTLVAMFVLSWQITLLSLVMLPVFLVPARWVGRRLAAITRESYDLNAKMNATMTERFNVAGAMLVKLYGQPEAESASFSKKAAEYGTLA